jgi:hypothetical protein
MATATATRATRTLKVIQEYRNDEGYAAVRIDVREGRKEDTYFIERANSEHGRGYIVSKSGGSTYRVTIEDDGATCECKGFRYGGKCRHLDMVKALVNRGFFRVN